ncbi:MAG: hypothetical protein JWP35_1862 [Caulobacter sp.]|nr:hypothetical protein [Caulobacter sp.]
MDHFDLAAEPGRFLAEPLFLALFVVIGLVVLGGSILILRGTTAGDSDRTDRLRLMGWWGLPFSAFWLAFVCFMGVGMTSHLLEARDRVARGEVSMAEGCLDYFQPGNGPSRSVAGDERWKTGGVQFEYGQGEVRFGYHRDEANGGIVHADSRVKVSFLVDPFLRRYDIVRLDVAQHACPPAPPPSALK